MMMTYVNDVNCLQVSRDTTNGNQSTIGPVHGAHRVGADPDPDRDRLQERAGRQHVHADWPHDHRHCALQATSAGTSGGLITVTLPFQAANTDGTAIGSGYLNRVGTGAYLGMQAVVGSSGTLVFFDAMITSGSPEAAARFGSGASYTFGLAANDVITFAYSFEAAGDA